MRKTMQTGPQLMAKEACAAAQTANTACGVTDFILPNEHSGHAPLHILVKEANAAPVEKY